MSTFVVMLRSINVGGRNRVAMADLRALVSSLGFGDVVTYLQSGNVVCSGRGGPRVAAKTIAGGIEEVLGLAVPVVVRTDRELGGILAGEPVRPSRGRSEEAPRDLPRPDPRPRPGRAASSPRRSSSPRIASVVAGPDVFLHCPGGYGETQLSNVFLERRLGVTATTRNWRTVEALAGLAGVDGAATAG